MIGRDLVQPLEDDWRDVLDGVARAHGWPTTRDVAALASRVAALSAAYNDPTCARAAMREAGSARLGFSFARDVPKGAAAVRELVATGALSAARTGLRVLDVGAGLGATTWGVARALSATSPQATGADGSPGPTHLEVTWVDVDAAALALATEVARARERHEGHPCKGRVAVRPHAMVRPVGPLDDLGRFDLVLAGQVLSELDVTEAPDEARVARHAALLAAWLDRRLEPHGSLVVVEPALRDRTRHLHRVRDALVASGATVFAPCLHAARCPALAHENDWCHEDLDVDLPAWLAPVARAAGLRREGLTFSYLVLRKDGRRLIDAIVPRDPERNRDAGAGAARLRVVSSVIASKGKSEAYLCGDLGGMQPPPHEERSSAQAWAVLPARATSVVRARVARLDRHISDTNAAWDSLTRGDLVTIDPAPELERPRVDAKAKVTLAEPYLSPSFQDCTQPEGTGHGPGRRKAREPIESR